MESKAFIKYISALLLFGLNGIVASHIPLNSYEIVFLRTLIGSILLMVLFFLGKGKFHTQGDGSIVFLLLSSLQNLKH